MADNSKGRRIRQRRYVFFFACLASLLGLAFYIFGRHKIPFPHQWLPKIDSDESLKATKLFFSGISIHLQINFFLGMFFMLLNTEKMDQIKLRKWRFWISKGLVFVASLIYGLIHYWKALKVGGEDKVLWGQVIFLCLIITVINCCLLELLIQLMNQYGICNAFNLILFTEFLPYHWIQSGSWKFSELFLLFLITIFFIWIINLKWEVPVETNTLYTQDSKLLKKNKSKLGFRLSFGFMPLIYLSTFISYIYTLVLMRRKGTNWFDFGDVSHKYKETNGIKVRSSLEGKGFWESFLHLGDSSTKESKRIFDFENIGGWFKTSGWIIIGVLFFIVFLRWLVTWLEMRKVRWETSKISKELRGRGIYVNQVSPGTSTRNLLRKIIDKLVVFWNFIVLIFNIVFDNIFKNTALTFANWFGGVNIGVDLVRQIQTKYKYIEANT